MNEKYFIEKLQSVTDFDKEGLSSFKTEIVNLLVKNPFENEEDLAIIAQILKIFLVISGKLTVSDTSVQIQLLVKVCGDKIRGIVKSVISFTTAFSGENLTFLNALDTTGGVLNLVLPDKNVSECETYLTTLVSTYGSETSYLRNLNTTLSKMKDLYTQYLPDDIFNIENLSKNFTSFIKSKNTSDYDHTTGDTIKIKLQNIQSNIFDKLEMSYSDLTKSLNIDKIKIMILFLLN